MTFGFAAEASANPPVTPSLSPDAKSIGSQICMSTTKNSALAIGFYPTFKYNASGGGGIANVTAIDGQRVCIQFDPKGVNIPPLSWKTALWLYAPLPPIFNIQIIPSKLEGWIDLTSGEIELNLSADFLFSAAGLYKVPLHVDTRLTTEAVDSKHHHRQGDRLDSEGRAVLVGVGTVEPTGSYLINKVLRLPTDVLGLMRSQFLWLKQ